MQSIFRMYLPSMLTFGIIIAWGKLFFRFLFILGFFFVFLLEPTIASLIQTQGEEQDKTPRPKD
jgi:multisubunit Na+/H+ antiporter MnhG subunit